MTTEKYDIVISGGGLSGALTALSLAALKDTSGKPLSIAIVEASPVLKNPSISFDDRVLALSHGSAQYLKKVGAWQYLQNSAEAIKDIHISDRGFPAKARISASKQQVSALGYVIEMSLIGKSLLTALANKPNVTWFAPDSISNITWQQSQVDITLASNKQLAAKLLLGCDGANSVSRQFANIAVDTQDYGQVALIANVATAKPHNNLAYERFTESGPIAMLPLSASASVNKGSLSKGSLSKGLSESRCSLVWTLTPEKAQAMQSLNDKEFAQALEHAFGTWLGQITFVGKRDVYPLKLVRAQSQVFHRMALIGNATHTIHPIAGQGFNLGLRDVQALTEMIDNALKHDQNFADFSLLSCYEAARKKDHDEVITLTDSLVTLFSNQLLPLVIGRNIGLKLLDHFSIFKDKLVKKTMGY